MLKPQPSVLGQRSLGEDDRGRCELFFQASCMSRDESMSVKNVSGLMAIVRYADAADGV